MADIRSTKASFTVVAEDLGSPFLRATKGSLLSVINFPTENITATFGAFTVADNHSSRDYRVTQAGLQAIVLGRNASPRIRVWTFTLDSHDYYVINTPFETLVYDVYTEQWYNWASANLDYWFIQNGINWLANLGAIQSGVQGAELLSNVICGDGTENVLYWLSPEKFTDDRAFDDEPLNFLRSVYGQLAMRGHNRVPIYMVELAGSIGQTGFTVAPEVTLSYYDTRGRDYVTAGTVSVPEGDPEAVISWRGLGSMTGPGRLFKIEDYGALVRIDGLDMPDGE